MKLSQIMLFGTVCFIGLQSCSKKDETPANPNSGKLKSIKIEQGTRDYMSTDFEYDASGRVISIKSFDIDSTRTPAKVDSSETVLYNYGSGNLATGYRYMERGTITYTGSYRYDASNRLVADSANMPASTGYVTTATYESGRIILRTRIGSGPSGWEQRDTISYSGENIIRYSQIQTVSPQLQVTTYTTSSTASPIFDLNVAATLLSDWMGFAGRNLPASEQLRVNGVLTDSANYTHVLGSNGKVAVTNLNSGGFTIRIFWQYY